MKSEDDLHPEFHGLYEFEWQVPEEEPEAFVTAPRRWTDGGGTTTSLGGSGGTITWSLGGAGLTDQTGAGFFSGQSVDIGSFVNYDFAAEIERAFDAWSAVAGIDFVQVADGGGNIGVGNDSTLRFVAGAIDGNSNTLAQAFFPSNNPAGGDVVFDTGDASLYADSQNFFIVALHEIGHALGLEHEPDIPAVMNPFFNSNLTGLLEDDINGIRALYGPRDGGGTPPPPPPTDDFGQTAATSGTIRNNGSATGVIETGGDQDWFAVSFRAGTTYTIDLEGNGLGDTFLRGIYDPDETLIGGTTNDDGGNGLNSRVVFTASETGTHYISAGAFGSNTGSYTLSVENNGTAPPPPPPSTDDHGTTVATAGAVSVNGSSTGVIETGGDQDWFAVSFQAGTTYTVDLEGNTLGDTFLRGIFDPDNTLIDGTTNDDGGDGLNSRVIYTAATTGIHHVSAGAFGDGTGSYTLSVTGDVTDSVTLRDASGAQLGTFATIAEAADLAARGDVITVDGTTYTGGTETVEIKEKDLTFDLGTGVTTVLNMANDDIVRITVTGAGNATISSNTADNMIRSGEGSDLLIGRSGADDFDSGAGDDRIRGNSGNDVVAAGDGDDRVDGGSGGDLLRGGNGDDFIEGEGGNDVLNGQGDDDILRGGGGVDTVSGSSGNDRVEGNSGDDLVDGGGGSDEVSGGNGNDSLLGGGGNDMLFGNNGNDDIEGGSGRDTLNGNSGKDTLDGGTGDDVLIGGRDDDTLTGGGGEDTFVFSLNSDDDMVTDFDNNTDTLAIDDSLYSGTLTVREIVATFATDTDDGLLFDFGADTILLDGSNVTTASIVNDILIV